MTPRRPRRLLSAIEAALWLALCIAVSLVLTGCGGHDNKPTRDELDAANLQIVHSVFRDTLKVEHITELTPFDSARATRELRPLLENVGYSATFLLTINPLGRVGRKGSALKYYLDNYESEIRSVLKRARAGERSPRASLQEVRKAGAEVRRASAAWQKAIQADLNP